MQLTSFPLDKDKRFPYFLYSSSSRIDVEKRMTEKSSTWMEIRSFSFHLSSSSFADLFGCTALDSVPSELEIENLSVNLWSATIAMYAVLLSILKEENGKGSKLRKVTMLLLIQQIWIFFTQVFKIFLFPSWGITFCRLNPSEKYQVMEIHESEVRFHPSLHSNSSYSFGSPV